MSENLSKWLTLNKIPDLGNRGVKKLWDHFGSIDAIWEARRDKICDTGISEKIASLILDAREIPFKEVSFSEEIKVSTLDDKDYPKNLKNIFDPPSILYQSSCLLPKDEKAIAIVGTRRATHYGKKVAKDLARELASLGLTIISGMALGIDTAAHEGALEASGRTIAVLGCGVDVPYPPSNKGLMERIKQSGAIVSEFPPGEEPDNWKFPARNRIISGLTLGTIVIEGGYKSGAMITAKLALDQGREVFAVPGNIESELSRGPHWLIKQGAKLVEGVEDVLEELNMVMPKKMSNDQCFAQKCFSTMCQMSNECINVAELSNEEQKIVSVLSLEPRHIDSITIETEFSTQQVLSLLMMLEVKKVIRQLPGKMYILN
ncbi:MAG: DNA-processing protein DprA [Candidatus Margulisbacteria bacterium]|nr:DNA-processing protein DprA [Candidatus Margulisiibacteriota bacterium]